MLSLIFNSSVASVVCCRDIPRKRNQLKSGKKDSRSNASLSEEKISHKKERKRSGNITKTRSREREKVPGEFDFLRFPFLVGEKEEGEKNISKPSLPSKVLTG